MKLKSESKARMVPRASPDAAGRSISIQISISGNDRNCSLSDVRV
jgi:hypothetical protein